MEKIRWLRDDPSLTIGRLAQAADGRRDCGTLALSRSDRSGYVAYIVAR